MLCRFAWTIPLVAIMSSCAAPVKPVEREADPTEYVPPAVTPSQTPYDPPTSVHLLTLAPTDYVPPPSTPSTSSTVSIVYDLITSADRASWSSGAGELPWAGSDVAERGFAMYRNNFRMEDRETYGLILETHPQWVEGGYIEGEFRDIYDSGYVVGSEDTFVAVVGFLEHANTGNATFSVMIRTESGQNEWIGQVTDRYDAKLQQMLIPLSPWAGQRAYFVLRVEAGASSGQDWASWVNAHIQRAE